MTEKEMEELIFKMEANQITTEELDRIRIKVDSLASASGQTELETIFMTGWVLCEARLIHQEFNIEISEKLTNSNSQEGL